ncbi:GntR family transcriptional regulator [Streptacidiphilus sp. EB129]|uniref:GntR family transcriptional regulator n=1 Tax=Streptacidiphilus sp. EB129 TaxID=3156262 RepID=UPI003515DC77
MAVIKTEALYKQVANEMRNSITSGEWPPGSKVPTEEQLSALYEVSRPTVRQAAAALRTEGLLDIRQGKGTYVRDRSTGAAAIMNRNITRTATGYAFDADAWTQAEEPTSVRLRIDPDSAALLDIAPGEAAYGIERPLIHQPTGTRALHRMILPMERITGTPLAKKPTIQVSDVFAALAAAHGELEWHETVDARMPHPDERASLHLPEAVPLLIAQRLTLTEADQRPLTLETTSLGAGRARFAYTIQAGGAVGEQL